MTAGDSTVIPAGGFVVLFADENGSEGWNHMNFKLSSLGEPLALRSPDGFTVADSVFVPELGQDRSWGREFDAHPNWITFFIPTPNASNGVNSVEVVDSHTTHELYPNPSVVGTPIFFQRRSGLQLRVATRPNNRYSGKLQCKPAEWPLPRTVARRDRDGNEGISSRHTISFV